VLKSYNIELPEGSDADLDYIDWNDSDADEGSMYSPGGNSTTEMKFWYYPKFPAMLLKYTMHVYKEEILHSSIGTGDRLLTSSQDVTCTIDDFH
jgi:hypothetical protein